MQPGARGADDPLIFVFSHVSVFVRPVLDVHRCRRAGENEMGHLSRCDGPVTPDHDLAQGRAGVGRATGEIIRRWRRQRSRDVRGRVFSSRSLRSTRD
jgi:hypothetical protein